MQMIIVVALALVAAISASPIEKEIPHITVSELDQQPNGSYKFKVETSDGTKREEEATLKQVVDEDNKPHEVLVLRGSFSYVDNEGNQESITYEADENGYRAVGPSIPVSSRR